MSKSYHEYNELNPLLSHTYSSGPLEVYSPHKSVEIPYNDPMNLTWSFSLNDGGDINSIHWYLGEYYFNDYCCGYQYNGFNSGTGGEIIYSTMGPFCESYPWYFECEGKYYSNSAGQNTTYVLSWCIEVKATTGYPCDPCNPAGSCDNIVPSPGGASRTEDGDTTKKKTTIPPTNGDGCRIPAFEPITFFLSSISCLSIIFLIVCKKRLKKRLIFQNNE